MSDRIGRTSPGYAPDDAPEDLGFDLPPPARASRLRVLVAVAALAGGAFAIGYVRHRQARGEVPAADPGRAVRV